MATDLEKFHEELGAKQSDPVAEVRQLATELALGVHKGLWPRHIRSFGGIATESLSLFLMHRWGGLDALDNYIDRLHGHGYVEQELNELGLLETWLTRDSFDLLTVAPPHNVFVSYKRTESSAFSLLISSRLKEKGLVPFLDMALEAGGNWHADLELRIQACDYFIILLGRDTLSSPMTLKEIQWALEYGKSIIPTWHSGFDIKSDHWSEVPAEVMDAIQQTNAIRVTDESASGYNSAIVELLGRFGVMP